MIPPIRDWREIAPTRWVQGFKSLELEYDRLGQRSEPFGDFEQDRPSRRLRHLAYTGAAAESRSRS